MWVEVFCLVRCGGIPRVLKCSYTCTYLYACREPGPYILCPWAPIRSTWVPNVDQMDAHGHKCRALLRTQSHPTPTLFFSRALDLDIAFGEANRATVHWGPTSCVLRPVVLVMCHFWWWVLLGLSHLVRHIICPTCISTLTYMKYVLMWLFVLCG